MSAALGSNMDETLKHWVRQWDMKGHKGMFSIYAKHPDRLDKAMCTATWQTGQWVSPDLWGRAGEGRGRSTYRARNHRVLRPSCTFEQFFLWGRSESQEASGHGSVTDRHSSRHHAVTTLILDHWYGRWILCSDSCMAEQVTSWESPSSCWLDNMRLQCLEWPLNTLLMELTCHVLIQYHPALHFCRRELPAYVRVHCWKATVQTRVQCLQKTKTNL